jgi:hypothetical protein
MPGFISEHPPLFKDIRQTDVGTIGSRVGSDLSSLEDVAPRILGYELGPMIPESF